MSRIFPNEIETSRRKPRHTVEKVICIWSMGNPSALEDVVFDEPATVGIVVDSISGGENGGSVDVSEDDRNGRVVGIGSQSQLAHT